MNNEIQSWKCPSCDTLNTGRRCVVCGGEKPSALSEIKITMQQGGKSAATQKRGLWIILCCIAGALIIGIIVLFAASGNREDKQIEKEAVNSHEIEEEAEQKEEREKEDEYVSDPVFGVKFNLSADKHLMDKNPDYEEMSNDSMVYTVPGNFEGYDNSRYFAKDNTAYIKFTKEDMTEPKPSDVLALRKSELGGKATYDEAGADWYTLAVLRNNIVYYTKGIIYEDTVISLVFAYPEEYRDIYDDYAVSIGEGFKLPDMSGIEIIEE